MPLRIGQARDHGYDEPLGLLSDCHRRIEHFLHALRAIAGKANGGDLTAVQRLELEAALTYFATAAPKHTADEEESLFPRLRESADPAAAAALDTVARLEHDHDRANEHHRSVDALGRRWLAAGSLDARDSGDLGEHLEALRAIYKAHIAVEDHDLFPAASRLLSADQIASIGREMAARRARRP